MSLAERFQGADETDKQLLEAFEAMREALRECIRDLEDEVDHLGQIPTDVKPLRAALALADKVTRP